MRRKNVLAMVLSVLIALDVPMATMAANVEVNTPTAISAELTSRAASTTESGTYGDFTYTVENGEVTLTKYNNKTATSVTIPEYIGGKPVTTIGVDCFDSCSNIKSVDFGDVVQKIEFCSFFSCKNLEVVTLPSTVTYIGYAAFGCCDSLKSVYIPKTTKLRSLTEDVSDSNLIFYHSGSTGDGPTIYSTTDSYAYEYWLTHYKGRPYTYPAQFFDTAQVPLTGLTLASSKTVDMGNSVTFSPSFVPSNTTFKEYEIKVVADSNNLKFSSSPNAYKITGNKVLFNNPGTYYVTAVRKKTDDTKVYMSADVVSNTCTVTVKDTTKMSLEVDGESIIGKDMYLGLKDQLAFDCSLSSSIHGSGDSNILISSSDSTIASVGSYASNGRGFVTGKKEGTATITVRTKDGLISESFDVTVTAEQPTRIEISCDEELMFLKEHGSQTFTFEVYPSDSDYSCKVTNSNPEVIGVKRSYRTVTITPLSTGTSTITISAVGTQNTVTKEITVTVAAPSISSNTGSITMYKGDYYDLSNIVSSVSGTGSDLYDEVSYGSDYMGFFLSNGTNDYISSDVCGRVADDSSIVYVSPNATHIYGAMPGTYKLYTIAYNSDAEDAYKYALCSLSSIQVTVLDKPASSNDSNNNNNGNTDNNSNTDNNNSNTDNNSNTNTDNNNSNTNNNTNTDNNNSNSNTNNDKDNDKDTVKATASFNVASSFTMKKGKTVSVKVTESSVSGDRIETVKVVSGSKTVSAKVSGSSLKIKAKKAGTAKLKITTLAGAEKTVKIKVSSKTVNPSISIKSKVSVSKGKSYKLTYSLKKIPSSGKVTFTSSNKKVATVGKTSGTIKGKKKGSAKITVKVDGKKVKTVKVNVK